MPTSITTTPFLRAVLLADAAACGAMGLLLAAAAGPLAGLLALPQPLLLWVGLFLLPWAAFVAWLGTRARIARAALWCVIGLNALWVLESLLLPLLGWVRPNGLGAAFLLAQAAAVAGFAVLQVVALRRGRRHEAAAA